MVGAARTDKHGVELVLVCGEETKLPRHFVDFGKRQNRMQPDAGQGECAAAQGKTNQPTD